VDELSLTRVATMAGVLADPLRLGIVDALARDGTQTVTELSDRLGAGLPAISNHLKRLRSMGLVRAAKSGRLVYYQLAAPAYAEALDALRSAAGVGPANTITTSAIASARTCYDHIAGRLGVGIYDHLLRAGGVEAAGDDARGALRRGPSAAAVFAALGVDIDQVGNSRRRWAYRCRDWTERRDHLAGAVGAAVCRRLIERGWLAPLGGTRALQVTDRGRRGFAALKIAAH
jgi:DNA-binding transcriptional ArsR family regulator